MSTNAKCINDLKRVVQIAIVTNDIDKTVELWSKILGVEKPRIIETEEWEKTKAEYRDKPTRGRAKLAFIELQNIVLEFIEPIGGPSTWREFLEKHGPGIHHIAFNVENVNECVELFKSIGGDVVQRGFFEGGLYIYIDAVKALGAIVELLHHYSDRGSG